MNIKKGTLRWLSEITGRKKLYIMCLLPLDAFFAISGVLRAFIFRMLIDTAVSKDKNGFILSVFYMLLLTLGSMALNVIYRLLLEWISSGIEISIMSYLFEKLMIKDYTAVSSVHSGDWLNRLTGDVGLVTNGVTTIIPDFLGMIITLISTAVAIIVLEPFLASIIIPGGLVILLITYFFRKILKRYHKEMREAETRVFEFLQERLGNLLIIRTFGTEKRTLHYARERMKEYRRVRMRNTRFSAICNTGFGLAANFAFLGGAVYCGFQILDSAMTYGTMMAILQLVSQIQSPFASLTGFIPRFFSMIASAERLKEIEDFPEETEVTLGQAEIHSIYDNEFLSFGLDQVTFTYKDRQPDDGMDLPVVLQDMSIEIHKGDFVALIGQSGCGKSTMFKLLMGIYPVDSGERYMNTKTGRIPLTYAYRGLFAYVPQGNHLMSGSIRDIIAFGDQKKMNDDQLLIHALHIACIDDIVLSLEHGLDTMLRERGTGMSEGQMQRLAVARAILSDRPIILLDEATSALDEETEKKLLQNLRSLTDKTVVIVTHRPAALNICDITIAF